MNYGGDAQHIENNNDEGSDKVCSVLEDQNDMIAGIDAGHQGRDSGYEGRQGMKGDIQA
jgi:hypothetical protein